MFRSEGCHSCRGVDCDYKIPDPTNKTSWRTQVRKWKTYKDPKDYQTRQCLTWSLDTIIQGAKKDKWIGRVGRRKCQTASSTPQQRNPRGCRPMTKITSRWLLKLVWHWKNAAHAVPCIEKKRAGKPQAIEAIEEQAVSEKTGACGTVKRQHMDHIAEKRRCGEFSLWLGTQASFLLKKLWKYLKPKPQWIKNGTNQRQFQRGMSRK